MRKNLIHFIFIIVLCIISFKHYQFAVLDKRNAIDFHEQFYGAPIVDYCYTLENQADSKDVSFYARVLGLILKVFGKNYFVLRLSYLLFFLLYLVAFYLSIIVLSNSSFVALMAVLLHISIPGIISYSRMCWPHLYAGSFILLGLVFLSLALDNKKNCYLYYSLVLLCCYLAEAVYYTSFVYIFILGFWFILKNHKVLFDLKNLKKVLLCVIALVAMAGGIFFEKIKMLIVQFATGNHLTLYSYTEYKLIFINKPHLYIFLFFSVFSFFTILFQASKKEKINLSIYMLFFLFSLAASGIRYPPHVVVQGISAACLFIAWFVVKSHFKILRNFLVLFIFVFSLSFNFFPEKFISAAEATMYFYKMAIIPDTRNWGREEFKTWLLDKEKNNVKIALLAQPFYPNNGTNYMQLIDIDLMSAKKQNFTVFTPDDFYSEPNLNYVNSLSVEIISDKEVSVDKFRQVIANSRVDYLVVDEIYEPYSWLFASEMDSVHYDIFKKRLAVIDKPVLVFDYNQLAEKFLAKLGNSIKFYFYEIGHKHQYTEGYGNLNRFLKKSIVLKEEKRIKCPVKDIVIYRIEK